MATSNLISKSLVGILLQNGDGVPDHSGTTSNIYFNSIDSELYALQPIYSGANSTTGWNKLRNVVSASISSTNNSTTIVTSAVGSWVTLSSSTYTWNTNYNNGFDITNGRLTLTASTGNFMINMSMTVNYSANLANYRMGISKNSSIPSYGDSTTGTLYNATALYQTINVFSDIVLVSGDTITMVFNSPDVASTTSIMSGASITIDLIS